MPEAHQAERIVLVLRALQEFRNVLLVADLLQHFEHGLVCAAMGGPPESRDTRGDAGERVSARGTRQADRRGRGVLLMVGVEDEDPVHRLLDCGAELILLGGHAEGHAQEVARVAHAVARIHERLADRVLVGPGGNRRHLCDQAVAGNQALLRIVDVC